MVQEHKSTSVLIVLVVNSVLVTSPYQLVPLKQPFEGVYNTLNEIPEGQTETDTVKV
jgi:hypothetical protein